MDACSPVPAPQEYYLNVLVAPPRSEQSKLAHVLDSGAVRALQNLVKAGSLRTPNAPCQAGSGMCSHGPALIIISSVFCQCWKMCMK